MFVPPSSHLHVFVFNRFAFDTGDWFEEAIDFTDSEDEMDTQTANNKVEQQQVISIQMPMHI